MNEQTKVHPGPLIHWPKDLGHIQVVIQDADKFRRYTLWREDRPYTPEVYVDAARTMVGYIPDEVVSADDLRHLIDLLRAALLVMEAEEAARTAHEVHS